MAQEKITSYIDVEKKVMDHIDEVEKYILECMALLSRLGLSYDLAEQMCCEKAYEEYGERALRDLRCRSMKGQRG